MAAKLAPPRVDSIVVSRETLDAYRRGRERRLTLVCAPAGYGKTASTATVLERLNIRPIWYNLDVLDHDPAMFLVTMAQALRRRIPEFGERLLGLLDPQTRPQLPLEEALALFAEECGARIKDNLTVVLDDYHEAADSPGLNRTLDYFLGNLTRKLHLVVLTRYDPAFSVQKLRIEDQVVLIGVEALRFDADQAADVLARRFGRRPRVEHVRRLVDLTEGWAASIVLAGLTLHWLDLDSLEAALADPRLKQDVYSYLAEQVYRREGSVTRRFLKRTCCLEHITPEIANQLVATKDAHRQLAHLSKNHVFTFAMEERGTFRYHNLFRDYLRQRCLLEDGDRAYRELQLETARVLEGAGEVGMAVELLLQANETVAALEAVARSGEAGLDKIHSDRIASWLQRVRPALAAEHPWALILESHLNMRRGEFDLAIRQIDAAIAMLEEVEDTAGLYQAFSIKECTQFWNGDLTDCARTCEHALTHAQNDSQAMHSLLSLASAALDMRDWPAFDEALERAQRLAVSAEPAERLRAQALQAHARYFQGEVLRAGPLISSIEQSELPPALGISVVNTHGMIELSLGNYAHAQELFSTASDAAERYGYRLARDMVMDNIGFTHANCGLTEQGLSIVRVCHASALDRGDPTVAGLALSHEATILRRAGRIEQALRPCDSAVALVPARRDPYVGLNCLANLHLTLSLLGDPQQAKLQELAGDARSAGLAFVESKAHLYTAIVDWLNGHERRAIDRLVDVLGEMLRLGHVHLVAQELCPRPDLVSAMIADERGRGLAFPLMHALACHWDYAALVAVVLERAPDLADAAVSAAEARAKRKIVTRVRHLAQAAQRPSVRRPIGSINAGSAGSILEADPRSLSSRLTARESEILALIAAGHRNPEIAAELFLSPATVKTHVNHILTKLEVSTRVEAILKYQEEAETSGR